MKNFKAIIWIVLVIYAEAFTLNGDVAKNGHVSFKSDSLAGAQLSPFSDNYKYVLSMKRTRNFRHFCGATRLAEKWAITAAHCVSPPLKLNQFYVETTNGEEILVDKIFQNDLYTEHFKNDIALLKLKIDNASTVETAMLPTHTAELHEKCLVLVNEHIGAKTDYTVVLYTYDGCVSYFLRMHYSKEECGNQESYCYDFGAGAPIMCMNNNNTYELTGIVSYDFECTSGGAPRFYIYTGTYDYIKWINETMF